MCGRFTLTADHNSLVDAFPGVVFPEDIVPRFNIAPTQAVAAIRNTGTNTVEFLRWGLIPHWAKDQQIGHKMINARAETLTEKPSFREPFKKKRCLILADGFYEWRKDPASRYKIPMYIKLKNGGPFAFAGLWDTWHSGDQEIATCTIITTSSNELVARIHDRMPVIIQPDGYSGWIGTVEQDAAHLQSLLAPYPSELMTAFQVSAKVNDPNIEGHECIMPVP